MEMENIKSELPKLLFDNEDGLKNFKRDKYEEAFRSYYGVYLPLFDEIEKQYQGAEDKHSFVEELADYFVSYANDRQSGLKKKIEKENFLIDRNSMMAVYVFPAILEYRGESSEPLANAIVAKWNAVFTKYTLKMGKYEDIKNGFRTKLCYVTTAVCESLGKDEDCYELRLLKDYRDHYLSSQPDGRSLIDEYYNIAPTIVNRINKRENAQEIYRNIFKNYISPCIHNIEAEDNESCKETYINMIRILQKEYMGCHYEQ